MKIINKIMKFFYKIWKNSTKKGRQELKVDEINKALALELQKKSTNKIKLRRKILRDYNSRKPALSLFIPQKGKNREKVKAEVKKKYGNEMSEVGLKITDDLQLK